MASFKHTFTSGQTVTPARLNDARDVFDIVNADIKSDAAIAGTKIAPNFGSQNVVTTGSLSSGGITAGASSRIQANVADFRIVTSSGRGWRLGTGSTGTSHGNFYIQGTTDDFASSFVNSIDITNTGLVGINTATPSTRLHVNGGGFNGGGITCQSTDSGNGISVIGFDGAGVNDSAFLTLSDQNFVSYIGLTGTNATSGAMRFATNNTERMRITSAGNVGIAAGVSPGSPLTVGTGSGQFTTAIAVQASTHGTSERAAVAMDDWILNQDTSGNGTKDFGIFQGSASLNRMYFATDGRVAIGTTNPNADALLDLTSTTSGFLPPRMTTTQRNAITTPPAGLIVYNSTDNKLQVRTNTAWVDLH